MSQAAESTITNPVRAGTPGVEIPQSPRFAVQHLTEGRWETLTFGTCGDVEPEDSPYHGRELVYHSRYIAEHIAKAYPDMTIRVHELGTETEERAVA